ncbi:hypothetical protein BT69DRAFT_1345294 [Atractiella rhizophila]|nr:hypothetical protein BT69DRAFT_1345294 [Atractiella rhizophila]
MASTSSFMLTPTRSPPRTPPPVRQTLSLRLLSPPPLPQGPIVASYPSPTFWREKENKKKVKKAFSSTPTGLFTPSASPDALMEIDQKNVFEVSFDRREREGDEKKGGEKERGLRLGIGLLPAFELA